MPMVDFKCGECGRVSEHFFHHTASWDVFQYPCECGSMAARSDEILHAPAVVWTGPITSRYRDKDKPGFYGPKGNGDGMNVYTRKTPDGKPKLVHLDTWGDVKEHCAREHLVDPREYGRNMTVSEDGKTLKADMGAKGTEV